MPFVFGVWGTVFQFHDCSPCRSNDYDQTHELRTKTDGLEKQAAHVPTHDRLTELPTRALFYDRVERAINATISTDNPPRRLATLLIEVENYEDIYETLGRNSSDLILKQISTRLQSVSL